MSRASKFWAGPFLVVAVAGSLAATAVPGQAATGTASAGHTPKDASTPVVVATGLANPRGLAYLPDGSILVAESGSPDASCPVPSAGSVSRCLGTTGAVYRVKGSTQGAVATGLPAETIVHSDGSVAMSGANQALPGPGGTYTVLYGLGGLPADRAALGAGAAPLGTVSLSNGTVIGDLTQYEYDQGLDVTGIATDTWNFAQEGSAYLVTDAGSNALFKVCPDGTVSTVYEFPNNALPSGTSAQAVPTGIVRGADGAYYIGDMSGLAAGAGRIWRYVPGQTPTVLATGLTDIIGLALAPDGKLVVLEYGTTAPGASGVGPGALALVDTSTGAVTSIDTGGVLTAPTGVAVSPSGDVYVDNNTITTSGELLEFPGAAS